LKGFSLLWPGKPKDKNSQYHRVVGTEQALEEHEEPDGYEIGGLDVQNCS